MAQPRYSAARLIAFAAPSIPIAALGLPLGVYLPPFYAGPMGLGLATVGTIFLVARLWDVFIDPILGYVSDRFPTRWGRRRHWLVLSVPIIACAAYFVFIPTPPITTRYLLAGLFVLYLGFTMILLAHMSWAAELSDDYHERSRIHGYREALAIIGVPLVLMLPAIIERVGAANMERARVGVMGWFIIVALPVTVLLAIAAMPEHPTLSQPEISFREAMRSLLRNRALQLVSAADLASGFSLSALGAMFLYEANFAWQVGKYSSLLLLLYYLAGVAFIPVVLRLSYRFGKHRTLIAASIFNAVFTPLALVVPRANIFAAAVLMMFVGVNVASPNVLYRSIMADIVDFDEVETGQRRTGLFYALLTLTAKVGNALAIGVVYWILSLIGFRPEGANSAAAIRGLSLVFVAVPFVCNLAVVLLMRGFPIGPREHEEIRRILDDRAEEKSILEQQASLANLV